MIDQQGLLYIEPQQRPLTTPVIDDLTWKMAAALNHCIATGTYQDGCLIKGNRFRGWPTCSCGACSSNVDYLLPGRKVTNSLAVHYLAYHRHEVPLRQLERIRQLPCGQEPPSDEQLIGNRIPGVTGKWG
jgi:hypothetical protein